LADEIGYSVVGRATLVPVFGGFLLAGLVLGILLYKSRHPELLGWLGPAAALGAADGAAAVVLMGPAADLVTPALRFSETFGFSRAVRERMHRQIEERVGRPWSIFDAVELAPALTAPLLVVHDRGDAEIPWQHGAAITRAWRGAELLMTEGLGHRRILRDPDVVATTVAFIAARAAERGVAAAVDGDPQARPHREDRRPARRMAFLHRTHEIGLKFGSSVRHQRPTVDQTQSRRSRYSAPRRDGDDHQRSQQADEDGRRERDRERTAAVEERGIWDSAQDGIGERTDGIMAPPNRDCANRNPAA
jgi:hypothetical protein